MTGYETAGISIGIPVDRGNRKSHRTPCSRCKYTQIDAVFSTYCWTAYACRNPDSEYYWALLNVTYQGSQLNEVTWSGCYYGESVEGGGIV